MMALRVRELPAGDWLYEMKLDDYRALAFKAGAEVRLLSRNRTLFNDNYPVLIDALKSLKAKSFIRRMILRRDSKPAPDAVVCVRGRTALSVNGRRSRLRQS